MKICNQRNHSQQMSRQNPHLRGVQKQKQGKHHHKTYKNTNTLFTPQKAYMSQHKIFVRSKFRVGDLEKGWIIDSGASANMTPFKKDCINIQPTFIIIYLADGSSILCK